VHLVVGSIEKGESEKVVFGRARSEAAKRIRGGKKPRSSSGLKQGSSVPTEPDMKKRSKEKNGEQRESRYVRNTSISPSEKTKTARSSLVLRKRPPHHPPRAETKKE